METFLQIGIVGVLASLLVEWLMEDSKIDGRYVAVIVSLLFGGTYWLFSDTAIWQSVLGVLGAASTVYAFIFHKTEKKKVDNVVDNVVDN